MDFNNFKTKALEFKDKAVDNAIKAKDKAIELKDKAIEMKNKASDAKDNAVEKTTDTINSWKEKIEDAKEKVIETKENITNNQIELENIIKKSKTTTFKNSETWVEKTYKHRSIAIFTIEWSEFYKKFIYLLPVIITKAFSQNISVKLFKSKIEWLNLQDYSINEDELPALVVFEEEKLLKTIKWEENILKLVKSFSLDINKEIDEA